MKKELTNYVEGIISSLTLKHHVKEDEVQQIANYHGAITLYEIHETVTVAVHYGNSTAHILLLNKNISEIKDDVTDIKPEDTTAEPVIAKRVIIPIVVFSIKIGPSGYVAMKPGMLDSIYLQAVPPKKKDIHKDVQPIRFVPTTMGKDLFDTFITLQTLLYRH